MRARPCNMFTQPAKPAAKPAAQPNPSRLPPLPLAIKVIAPMDATVAYMGLEPLPASPRPYQPLPAVMCPECALGPYVHHEWHSVH